MKSEYKKILILFYIKSIKDKTYAELEDILGFNFKQVKYVLKILENDGYIVYNNGIRRAKLKEKGKEFLKIRNLYYRKFESIEKKNI